MGSCRAKPGPAHRPRDTFADFDNGLAIVPVSTNRRMGIVCHGETGKLAFSAVNYALAFMTGFLVAVLGANARRPVVAVFS